MWTSLLSQSLPNVSFFVETQSVALAYSTKSSLCQACYPLMNLQSPTRPLKESQMNLHASILLATLRRSITRSAAVIFLCTTVPAHADPPFEVKSVTSYVDTGIMLTWTSEPGALYEVQFSESMAVDSWKTLYPDMPSMGSSTFWTDDGDFTAVPEVPRPELAPRRFYRVFKVGENAGDGPTLTLDGITPSEVLSGEVTVTVTGVGTGGTSEIRLFVDGAEYDRRGGNPAEFVINTTEWRNGVHQISAAAVDAAGLEFQTTPSVGSVEPSYSAIPGIEVSFQNYVSHFKFSEDLFDPESGETQVISASFEKNSSWTLEIRDETDTLVRSATGTGNAMSFAWDGNGEAAAILPQGSYSFQVLAEEIVVGGLRAPPATGAAPPPRRVARKVRGIPGTVGIAWQGHHPDPPLPPNPPNPTFTRPTSGLPTQPLVTLVPNYRLPYGKINRAGEVAKGFSKEMAIGGWKKGLELGDDALEAKALRKAAKGGTSRFNEVNIGLLVGHGIHGESPDLVATNTGTFQTYFPIYKTGTTNYDWTRLSECSFGSAKLRWMAIYSCNMLHEVSYNSMYAGGVLPINKDLHLLLGARTSVQMHPSFGQKWASFMLGRENGVRQTVMEAWNSAGVLIHELVTPTHPVILRVVGWPECFGDTLGNYTQPAGDNVFDIEFRDRQVWTPQ